MSTSIRGWPSSLTSHVSRGVVRAVRESASTDGLRGGAATAATLAGMIANELLIFPLGKVGFAARATRYRRHHCTLVPVGEAGVEVYDGGDLDGPLVLFVHGGSWGQGAPWQYALLARRLLESGASRVGIVRYRLFPEGDVDSMVDDVAAAISWAHKVRGDAPAHANEIVVAGHSAGAHLCSLYLSRALVGRREAGLLPNRFVALSGVFDIAPHFAHERTRLVHWLSPMWLAMLGRRARTDDSGRQPASTLASDAGTAVPNTEGGSSPPLPPDPEGASAPFCLNLLADLAYEATRGAEGWGEGKWSASELQAWAEV